MTIGIDDVRHVARLAELAVAEADVSQLAADLERIVAFVEQLQGEAQADASAPLVIGPDCVVLREDVVDPIPMSLSPAQLAPAFEQDFFVVPKLGGLAEA